MTKVRAGNQDVKGDLDVALAVSYKVKCGRRESQCQVTVYCSEGTPTSKTAGRNEGANEVELIFQ